MNRARTVTVSVKLAHSVNTNTKRYSYSLASCSVYTANISPWMNIPSRNMRRIFVSRIGPRNEHPPKNMGRIFVRGRTLYQNVERMFVCGRIPSRKAGAYIRQWTLYPLPNVRRILVAVQIAHIPRMFSRLCMGSVFLTVGHGFAV